MGRIPARAPGKVDRAPRDLAMKRTENMNMERIRSTTVVAVLRDGQLALAADGQVTIGATVMKQRAEKVRRVARGRAIVGFAGGAADALTLMERLESKFEAHPGNVRRAAVELARDWRTDRVLRKLEAMMLLGDPDTLLLVSGNGDVLEPDDGIAAIGSGGSYALAAARSLARHTQMGAREIAEASLRVASEICIYTNDNLTVETLP